MQDSITRAQPCLDKYLDRIGYARTCDTSLTCLQGIHFSHAMAIPYENLDIHLGRWMDFDLARIYDKVVQRRRGGWCYEVHTLLAWALREIGFEVQMVAAGIDRNKHGDWIIGDHTALLVRLDRTYLVDLGLGDGLRYPIPLVEGSYQHASLTFRLERLASDYWRFHNHSQALPATFDFKDVPADLAVLQNHNRRQQTDADWELCANLVCQKMQAETVTCLTGRILRKKSAAGVQKTVIGEDEFEATLARLFGIEDPDVMSVWPGVAERHLQLFGTKPANEIDFAGF